MKQATDDGGTEDPAMVWIQSMRNAGKKATNTRGESELHVELDENAVNSRLTKLNRTVAVVLHIP